MNVFRRWITSALAGAALLTACLPRTCAAGQAPFAELRIDATNIQVPELTISVDVYQPAEEGGFQVEESRQYACKLNRTTRDATFFIQPNADNVWVSVDYLTDVNGDGVYELLEDPQSPVWDVMNTQGALELQGEEIPMLTAGQPYILSPDMLVSRSQLAIQSRITGGSCALDVGQGSMDGQEFPLCMVRLHCSGPEGSQEQTYYLQIADNLLIPVDVSPTDWYYNAVAFVLSQGWFTGSSSGLFLPRGQLSRAQLAQVLWAMSGSPQAEGAQFSDISPNDWFYQAASWCQQEGIIAGYSSGAFAPNALLSREQLVTILHSYAQYDGVLLLADTDLSRFPDGEETARWAAESMRWAVTYDIIPTLDGSLHPGAIVSRAELASALYTYDQSLKATR